MSSTAAAPHRAIRSARTRRSGGSRPSSKPWTPCPGATNCSSGRAALGGHALCCNQLIVEYNAKLLILWDGHANVKFEGLFAVVLRDWRRNLYFFVGTRRQLHPKVDTLFSSWNHPMSMHHRPSDVFFSVERFFDFVVFYSLVSQLGGRASVSCLKLELTSKRTTAVCF